MTADYHDLDGVRLGEVDGPNIWLVFAGKRHRVSSPRVYDSLFRQADDILLNPELDQIEIGFELNEGTCLIRFEDESAIYFATGNGTDAHIMHVASYDAFLDFGFDLSKVREVPAVFRDVIPKGEVMTSAPDRAARAGLPA